MKKLALLSASLAVMLIPLMPAAPAEAIERTWVASNGGGSACTRAAPCLTFQDAHNATDPGGEINCVDAGQFGAGGTIFSKSITVDCTGTFGGIAPTLGNVFIETAGSVVTLRGLSINGMGLGGVGIIFRSARALHIENCRIAGFSGSGGVTGAIGIKFSPPSGVARLYISDSVISDNGLASSGGGIIVQPTGSGSARVMIDRVQVHNNTNGIQANGTSTTGRIDLTVSDSAVSGNTLAGIAAINTGGGGVNVMVSRTESVNNATGIVANGTGATVRLSGSTVTRNGTGLAAVNGGALISLQNNVVRGNVTNGAPTATEALN